MEPTEVQKLLDAMELKFMDKIQAMQNEFDMKLKMDEAKYILLIDQQTKLFRNWADSAKDSTENNTVSLGKICGKIEDLEKRIDLAMDKKHSNKESAHEALPEIPHGRSPDGHVVGRIESMENAIYDLESNLKACEKQIDSIEDQSRRNNLKFYNIEETKDWESWAESEHLVRELMKTKCKLPNADDIQITRAHRLAKGPNQKKDDPRPLIVKFDFFKDRQTVLRASSKLKPFNIGVSEDFCTRTSDYRNNVLKPQMRAHRDAGKYAVMRHRRLIVKERLHKPNTNEPTNDIEGPTNDIEGPTNDIHEPTNDGTEVTE